MTKYRRRQASAIGGPDRRHRRWCVMDLVTDHVTGKMRWDPMAQIAATILILGAYWKFVSAQNFETMTTIVAATFIGSNVANRLLNLKQQREQPQAVTPAPAAPVAQTPGGPKP